MVMIKKEILKQIDEFLAKEGEAQLKECGFKRNRVFNFKDEYGYICPLGIYNKYNIEMNARLVIDFPILRNGHTLKLGEEYCSLYLTVDAPTIDVHSKTLFENDDIKSFDEFEKAFHDLIYYLIKEN
jgi:hypothetical protein